MDDSNKTSSEFQENQLNTNINSCPQFSDIKRMYNGEIIETLWYSWTDGKTASVDGWELGGGYENWQGKFVGCYKGTRENENINYYYCGEDSISPLLAIKKTVDSTGSIKKVSEQEVIIVLDSEGKAIETMCKS